MLALGVAACGSSSDSSSSSSSSSARPAASAAPSTAPARRSPRPIYQQWGSDLKDQGLTLNYQPRRLRRRRRRSSPPGTVDFAGTRPGAEADEEIAAAQEGRRRPDPDRLRRDHRRPTTSPASRAASSSTARRSPTSSSARSRSGTTRRSPGQNPGVKLPGNDDHGRPPLRLVGHDQGLHARSWPTTARVEERPRRRQDVKWPTGTGAKGNDGVAAAVKQTDGAIGYVEQAYALQNNFTFADVKNKSGKYIAPTLESTSAAGEGIDDPGGPRHHAIDAPTPTAYPIASQTFVDRLQGPVQGRASTEATARALKALPRLRPRRDGQDDAQAAVLRAAAGGAARPRPRPLSTAMHVQRQRRSAAADGGRTAPTLRPAAARSSSGRRARALPDRALPLGADGARRAGSWC